jgi:hypothetical protein
MGASPQYLRQLESLYGRSRKLQDIDQRSTHVAELDSFTTGIMTNGSVYLLDILESSQACVTSAMASVVATTRTSSTAA